MRYSTLVTIATLASVVTTLPAQESARATHLYHADGGSEEHRAALGIGVSSTGSLRDTLGVLVTSLTSGGPAERSGLQEGNRLAAINGVSLRAERGDIEDVEMSGALTHRLTRELAKVKPGDEVELSVYRDGRASGMRVRTVAADSLFHRVVSRMTRTDGEDRSALGFAVGSTASHRDTLGVFVVSVADSTPAARAGVEEGNRIAAINGVNLRLAAADAGDSYLTSSKAQRLRREISQLKVGDDVTLRVYANGQFRDLHMKAARAGDLPRGSRRSIFMGDAMEMMPPLPPIGTDRGMFGPDFDRGMQDLRLNLDRIGTELPRVLRTIRLPGLERTTIM